MPSRHPGNRTCIPTGWGAGSPSGNRMIVRRFAILALLFQAGTAMAQEYLLHTFEKIRLT